MKNMEQWKNWTFIGSLTLAAGLINGNAYIAQHSNEWHAQAAPFAAPVIEKPVPVPPQPVGAPVTTPQVVSYSPTPAWSANEIPHLAFNQQPQPEIASIVSPAPAYFIETPMSPTPSPARKIKIEKPVAAKHPETTNAVSETATNAPISKTNIVVAMRKPEKPAFKPAAEEMAAPVHAEQETNKPAEIAVSREKPHRSDLPSQTASVEKITPAVKPSSTPIEPVEAKISKPKSHPIGSFFHKLFTGSPIHTHFGTYQQPQENHQNPERPNQKKSAAQAKSPGQRHAPAAITRQQQPPSKH